jgi:hypothetical protein
MEDRITLNQAEQQRLRVLNHLEAGALVNAEAAELLGVSIRQVRRLRGAYRERGQQRSRTATAVGGLPTRSIRRWRCGWWNWPPVRTQGSTIST